MREIKFKAYLKKHKETVFVDFIDFFEKEIIVIDGYGNEYCFDFNEIELMQYTGLKDKNGKEIYEKDIVDFDGKKHMVTFANGGFGIWKEMRTNLYSDETRKYHEPLWNLVVDGCEIIGNIYENPELL